MIQRRNALRKILIAYPVDHIQMLSSMKVVETKPVGLRICCRCCACRFAAGMRENANAATKLISKGFFNRVGLFFGINSI